MPNHAQRVKKMNKETKLKPSGFPNGSGSASTAHLLCKQCSNFADFFFIYMRRQLCQFLVFASVFKTQISVSQSPRTPSRQQVWVQVWMAVCLYKLATSPGCNAPSTQWQLGGDPSDPDRRGSGWREWKSGVSSWGKQHFQPKDEIIIYWLVHSMAKNIQIELCHVLTAE